MAANRFFTIMVIPEKSAQIKKLIVPAWILKGAVVAGVLAAVLIGIMSLDYWYVMSQISENHDLRIENRKLQQQLQVYSNKMETIESTLDRIQTFATRLKVITNIEDRDNLIQRLQEQLPDAKSNTEKSPLEKLYEKRPESVSGGGATTSQVTLPSQPLASESSEFDERFQRLTEDALWVEQILNDQYELLSDQRAFLAALPTRKPALGFFTSGFGVRESPFRDGRIKMHEGLDISYYTGTQIRATADGSITYAASKAGYGQTVIIDHGYGLETLYAHNSRLKVKKGDRVKRGQLISQMGSTGRSTGPHLHYEVRVNGIPVDPLTYVLEN